MLATMKKDTKLGEAMAQVKKTRLDRPETVGGGLKGGGRAGKSEAKANARALKAANAKVSKGNATRQYFKDKIDMVQKSNPKMSRWEAAEWAGHPGYASQKSNQRLQAGKWPSDKQIKKWQDKEIKQDYGKKKSK